MRKASEIVGEPVVLATGQRVGTIADVLVDSECGRIAGFLITHGFLHKDDFLLFDDVEALGRDAVIVRPGRGVIDDAAWRERGVSVRRATRVRNRRAITTTGRDVGAVSDIYVNEQSGKIESLEVERPVLAGLLQERAAVPYRVDVAVGDDVVIVPDETATRLERNDSLHS